MIQRVRNKVKFFYSSGDDASSLFYYSTGHIIWYDSMKKLAFLVISKQPGWLSQVAKEQEKHPGSPPDFSRLQSKFSKEVESRERTELVGFNVAKGKKSQRAYPPSRSIKVNRWKNSSRIIQPGQVDSQTNMEDGRSGHLCLNVNSV